MVASAIDNLQAFRDEEAAFAFETDDHSESTGRLVPRRSQLSSLLVQLKELCAELARDFERGDAECLELETACTELETMRAELQAGRAQFQSKRVTVFAAQVAAAVVAAPDATTPDSGPDAAPVQEQKVSSAQTEVADSVVDYMVHLVGRIRSRKSGGVLAEDQPAGHSSRGRVSSENATSRPTDPALGAESPDRVRIPIPRRLHNVEEIRVGVATLREIANQSARAAVAKHSSQKFRKSLALMLPLAIISFALAGVLFLNEASESRFYSPGFGIVMLGLIALIELANSFWKGKNVFPERTLAVSETGTDARSQPGPLAITGPVTAPVSQKG